MEEQPTVKPKYRFVFGIREAMQKAQDGCVVSREAWRKNNRVSQTVAFSVQGADTTHRLCRFHNQSCLGPYRADEADLLTEDWFVVRADDLKEVP